MQSTSADVRPRHPDQDTVGTTILASSDIVVAGLTEMLGDPAAHPFRLLDEGSAECPDIVLYGVEATGQQASHDMRLHDLLRSAPSRAPSRVIATYWEDDSPAVAAALRCGAHGAVSMKLPREELRDALQALWGGPARGLSTPSTACALGMERYGLSTRELEVLGLVAEGITNQDVAQRMSVSINTVKTYIRTAYRKIGVERRSQAVLWTAQHGVTTPDWLREPGPAALDDW